jgi:anti-sigma factor RsiW
MNCRRLQYLLDEYVDGTLSARVKAVADKHLTTCNACRQAVRQEQQVAQSLSVLFREHTESMTLRLEVQHRVLTALECEPAPFTEGRFIVRLWCRFGWPLATAASLLIATLLLIAFFFGRRNPSAEIVQPRADDSHSPVVVQVRYGVPTYTFRKEGDLVIDTLAFKTSAVAVTLWVDQDRKPVRRNQERKMPL